LAEIPELGGNVPRPITGLAIVRYEAGQGGFPVRSGSAQALLPGRQSAGALTSSISTQRSEAWTFSRVSS
jgi:hypothetical protein